MSGSMAERPRYSEIEHTADVGLELTAPDLESAFGLTAASMFDLILYDLKHVDLEKCKQSLGTGSPTALDNLKSILTTKLPVEVRITLVPGFNDSDADLKSMAEFLNNGSRKPDVLLQPFHRLAVSKQDLFDREYPYADFQPMQQERIAEAARFFEFC